MISYDFARILGKSGVDLIHPPKMCAGLVQTSVYSRSLRFPSDCWRLSAGDEEMEVPIDERSIAYLARHAFDQLEDWAPYSEPDSETE